MGIYSKKQQVRTVVNKKTGESKVFKSSGVDALTGYDRSKEYYQPKKDYQKPRKADTTKD